LFLLFISYVMARHIVGASCLCLPVAAAATGQFWKADDLSILYVLIIKKRQSWAFVLRYYFWRNRQKLIRRYNSCESPIPANGAPWQFLSSIFVLILHSTLCTIHSSSCAPLARKISPPSCVAAFARSIAHGLPAPKPSVSPSSSHRGPKYLHLIWASYTSGSRNIV